MGTHATEHASWVQRLTHTNISPHTSCTGGTNSLLNSELRNQQKLLRGRATSRQACDRFNYRLASFQGRGCSRADATQYAINGRGGEVASDHFWLAGNQTCDTFAHWIVSCTGEGTSETDALPGRTKLDVMRFHVLHI